jgi:hypothetical protein
MRAKKLSKKNKPRRAKGRIASRDELLHQAETLGMEQLGWIHGGGEACGHCCIWGNPTKCSRTRTAPAPRATPTQATQATNLHSLFARPTWRWR